MGSVLLGLLPDSPYSLQPLLEEPLTQPSVECHLTTPHIAAVPCTAAWLVFPFSWALGLFHRTDPMHPLPPSQAPLGLPIISWPHRLTPGWPR